jgi:hypothetical protein
MPPIPAYVRLTDADTAALAFWGQDKWRQLRDNQDSFDGRILQLLAQSANSVVDDFLADGGATNNHGVAEHLYDTFHSVGPGTDFDTMVGSGGDHVLRMQSSGVARGSRLSVKAGVLAFRLNQDMALLREDRVKEPGAAAMTNIMAAFSDSADASDESDCIGWFKGSGAGKWRFRVAKGGVSSESGDVGNRATWQKLQMTIIRASGVLEVRAFIDSAEVPNSPFTTNIPDTVVLRKHFSVVTPGAGVTDIRLDRWETRWTAIPVNS